MRIISVHFDKPFKKVTFHIFFCGVFAHQMAKTLFFRFSNRINNIEGLNNKPLMNYMMDNKINTSELIASNRNYVEAVAKQYLNQGLELEQLIEEGNKGLVAAAERYDASKGCKFISYAIWWVRQSILQALADKAEGVEGNQLSDREQFILQHTNEEAAVKLEISLRRVQQIRTRALRKLSETNKTSQKKEQKRNINELLEKISKMKCIVLDRVLDDEMHYGTYPDLDEMVDSKETKHRIRIASLGYGLDKLKDDPDPLVRAEVAKLGYYRSQFIQDPSPIVRKATEY